MFKQSEIGTKCACGVAETVIKEHGAKRYRLPEGYYGGRYQTAGYFTAIWWSLRCDQCGHERDNFTVYHWSSNGDLWPVMPAFPREGSEERYRDVYEAIRGMM